MMKRLLAAAAALALAAPVLGQSTANNAVMGYLSSSNHSCGQTTCFVQYGAGIPPAPSTSGGASISSTIAANNTTSVAVKASAGNIYGISVFNNSGTIAYLKIYDAAQGSTTCGSGTPSQRILIPANTSGAGAVIEYPLGVSYATAITRCVTTGIADNDTSAPAASAYIINIIYK